MFKEPIPDNHCRQIQRFVTTSFEEDTIAWIEFATSQIIKWHDNPRLGGWDRRDANNLLESLDAAYDLYGYPILLDLRNQLKNKLKSFQMFMI